jgi:hypothetical protein
MEKRMKDKENRESEMECQRNSEMQIERKEGNQQRRNKERIGEDKNQAKPKH